MSEWASGQVGQCLLVAEEHLAQLLADVAELVLVFARELGDCRLRDVAELVVGVAREVAHLVRVRVRVRVRGRVRGRVEVRLS